MKNKKSYTDNASIRHMEVDMEELSRLMEDVFSQGGNFSFIPSGVSMLPMLREKRDTVVLQSPLRRTPSKYDIVLYKRENGQYVLHRVIKIVKSKKSTVCTYTMCGDNQCVPEPGIKSEQIMGVLCAFVRKGKAVSVDSFLYRCYSIIWVNIRPLRHALSAACRRIKRLFSKKQP